jgi:hypothetical protein
MVKPDGVERGLVGEIMKRFEQKGYQLIALVRERECFYFAAETLLRLGTLAPNQRIARGTLWGFKDQEILPRSCCLYALWSCCG